MKKIFESEKYDIIFLITGKPLPAMLDMAFYAQKQGIKSLMVVLERGNKDLIIDKDLVNFDIEIINVPYKGVDIRRILSVPKVFILINNIIRKKLVKNGVVMASSYDLLLFSWLISFNKKIYLRYQVRDLHALQLSRGFLSSIIVFIEKLLLKRVDSIIVSSPEFVNQYFKRIYKGKFILLENVPSEETWKGFKKTTHMGSCVIGFIGIIRYESSLKQLIEVVENIAKLETGIKVKFAGGGNIDKLKTMIRKPTLFEISGPYEYTKDIKRLYSDVDVIYAVYDSEDLNCQIAMPNKFYESIIAKIPIIVAKGTFVASEVNRLGIGASVYTGDSYSLEVMLRQAIENIGWYKNACKRLNEIEAHSYFSTYEIAIRESVSIRE